MASKPELKIRLNGIVLPRINVRVVDGRNELLAKDPDFGWIVVDDRPDMVLEWRDETNWMLLPVEMCHAAANKCWERATPDELIGILWTTGMLK